MSGGLFGQTLVRVRAGVRTDRGGNTVADWSAGAVTRETIDRVSVQPSSQTETTDGVSTVRITGYRVLSEPGTVPDITALDRIEYRGVTYTVEGEVAHWPDPDGDDHVEFGMRRIGGAA